MENKKAPWWQGPRGEGYVIIQFILFGVIFFAPNSLPGWPAWSSTWSTLGVVLGLAIGGTGGVLILAGLVELGTEFNGRSPPHRKRPNGPLWCLPICATSHLQRHHHWRIWVWTAAKWHFDPDLCANIVCFL